MDKLLAKEYKEIMKHIQNNSDIETAHQDADDLLCTLLRECGYGVVVDEYLKIKKWYA